MTALEPARRGGRTGHAPRSAVVIGGGVAGLAAALRLAEAGVATTLLETRRKLGGRATSFVDPRTGEVLDNCQHVLMGCCTNLLDFYIRLGVDGLIDWHETVYWANPPHAPDRMRPGLLPAPAHFTGSFAGMRMLTLAQKRAVARAMWAMLRLGRTGRAAWEGRVFGEFLQQTAQPAEVIERFWSPVVVSACNLDVDQASAASAMQVFQEGFLASREAPLMGLATVPLVRLYDPAEQAIAAAGGRVVTGISALSIASDGRRATAVITDDGTFEAEIVVSSVPPDRLARLVGPTMVQADRRLQRLDAIGTSPILGVHLRFPKPVMLLPHLVLPGRGTQWLFNKSARGPEPDGSQHLHAVISAAHAWMELDEAEIARRVLEDIRWALPEARGVEPLSVRSVKEKRATFACVPGLEKRRPTAAADGFDRDGGVRNLYLAGDWTRTGWPATMEGAVRSGYLAAGAALGEDLLIRDLPMGRMARALGLAR
ncbi:MAG: hydroxysqualene dehydroxylase HpnE [Phycisphaerales bacterium]